jgi:hypothetical protein
VESRKFGVAFLDDEGAEGKAKGDVIECEWFRVVREDGGRDRDLEWWGHSCNSIVFMGQSSVGPLGRGIFALLLYGVFCC